ncbi:MAG: sensor histidine kinase, partial [Desulfotignum sp.]
VLFSMAEDDEQKSYIQAISMAGRNLMGLVSNILDLSKIQAGKLTIETKPISLDTLFSETHQLFKARLDQKNLGFFIQIDADMPDYLCLDEIRIRQVLTNLIENAVKFTKKGHIRLCARIHAKQYPKNLDLVIRVEDTGMGIPKDKHELVFESFEQENADISRKYGGTGLGLSITKRLVELMQGSITLDSRPGDGSVFEILLPAVAISDTKQPAASSSADDPPSVCISTDTREPQPIPVLSKPVFQKALIQYP